eukprot:GGOE01014044.1.p1 GENE.GGOE01014044.1~~GGOE01014044.1.p1  ORF type:complete len:607 (-),score=200.26 GGOE01014044.1:116-1693(-)
MPPNQLLLTNVPHQQQHQPQQQPLVEGATSSSSSSSSSSQVSSRPIFTPTPMGLPFAAMLPRAAILPRPAIPAESVAAECQVFGDDQRSFEEKKAQSEFFRFSERVRNGELRLHGKEVIERQADGSWPEELQKEIDEQQAFGGEPEQRNWFDHFAAMDEMVDGERPEAEFGDFGGVDWAESFQKAMQHLQQGDGASAQDWLEEFRQQNQSRYQPQPNNMYEHRAQPFEEGLALLQAGNLPEAILCFEAAVKQDPSHTLAWQYLGTTHAENEQDPQAILAFQECLRLQPDNLTALLASASSLTNEARHDEALQALDLWLQLNPQYAHVPPASEMPGEVEDEEDAYDIYVMQPRLHAEVLRRFQQAASCPPGMQDPDVAIALGVIHHMVHKYDGAVTAFQRALQLRPEDSRLWNKLGATLANSRRSEDALVAYNRALDLNPGFVRAQSNLGIAYSNLGQHHEAAHAFLQALQMQQSHASSYTGSSMDNSTALWDVLRTTFTFMNRPDLVEKTHSRDLSAFQSEFRFM